MFSWLTGVFSGILEYLVPFLFKKSGTVIFVGLDDAGKSTLLYRLTSGKMIQPEPSAYPSSEGLEIGNVNFTAYDLGGHKQVRRVWKDYYVAADAVVFVIDGSNPERFDKAKEELDEILQDENIADAPVAVLMNKIDLKTCVGESDFIYTFGLYHKRTGRSVVTHEQNDKRPLEVFSVSILQCQGYGQAFNWLAQHMK